MFLLKTDIQKYHLGDDEISERIRENLESGKVSINYSFDNRNSSIHYNLYDPDFGWFCFHVFEDGRIQTADAYKFYPYNLFLNESVNYIHDKDKNASSKEMMKRYPSIYSKYGKMFELDTETYEKYKTVKNNLRRFTPQPQKKIQIDIPDQYVMVFFDSANPIDSGIKVMKSDSNINLCKDGMSLSQLYSSNSVFSDETKKILQAFIPILVTQDQIANNSSYYFTVKKNTTTYAHTLIHNLYLLGTQSVKTTPVRFNTNYFSVDPEIQNLSIRIDENGHIESNVNPKKYDWILTLEDDTQFLYFCFKKKTVFTYQAENTTSLHLLKFLTENPFINESNLFMEDIASSLVPKIENEIHVEQTFLTKALRRTDHIEYFLELDPVKNVLISKTQYFANEKIVRKEEFDALHPEKIPAFLTELEKLDIPEKGEVGDAEIILNLISADLKPLQGTAHVFISDELKKLKKKSVGKIRILINSETDWFSMNFSSDEYTPEEVDAILSAYQKKKKFFLLKDRILDLTAGEGKDLIKILDDIDLKSQRIPIYQSLKLMDCKDIELSERIKALFESIQNYEQTELHLPKSLNSILRPYQNTGVRWLTTLKENHLSGILADDMGLGKTLEMIAFLSQYRDGGPNLIVTPKSLTFNWEDEFRRFDPESKVVVLTADPATRKAKVAAIDDSNVNYIISYDSLRLDLDLFKDKRFQFLILDEGQYIANALAQKTRAVKSIQADFKFALTGTPIQNSLMDLWSIFDFLMPGYLKSFSEFKKKYGKLDLGEEDRKHLEHVVSPFLLKRKKDDVLNDLPGKTVVTQKIAMSEKEISLYQAFFIKARNTLNVKDANGKVNKLAVLAALTRLRQICVDPSVFLEYNDISSKLEYTLYVIKEAVSKGHKVLLFSSFTSVLDHIESLFRQENIRFERIDGDVSAKKRLELANRFNKEDDLDVMLISLKAGGTGLNLIGADIVIHLDPWWNVAAEDQASDRAYRIGQTRKVTVYKIVMKDTIEEKVLSLQEKKKNLADIFDSSQGKSILSEEDLQYLLS